MNFSIYTQVSLLILCFFTAQIGNTQIIINEVVSSNTTFLDSDGDSPDWIELYNTSIEPVVLDGWSLTDDEDDPQKWTFENTTIDGNQHLLIWASSKDIKTSSTPRTLIEAGDSWRYIIPDESISGSWIDTDFDDNLWMEGPIDMRYGDDTTEISEGVSSIFLRRNFSVSNIDKVKNVILHVDYDDAFVAYLNGVEVTRENIEGDFPIYSDTALVDVEARLYLGRRPKRIDIPVSMIVEGQNTIAIQAHSFPADSTDLTIIPFLSAYYSGLTEDGNTPPEILNLPEISSHTNFKLAEGEHVYLYNTEGQEVSNLVVMEMPTDVSTGRRSDDQTAVLFYPSTPRKENMGSGYEGFLDTKITFSHEGGVVDSFILSLEGIDSSDVIRYTLDATIPNDSSRIYSGPININKNTVVRARVYSDGLVPSKTESRCYIVEASHSLPVMSLITDPDNFFSDDRGIFVFGPDAESEYPFFEANIWKDWERPVHVSLYEQDSIRLMLDAGAKIFGASSRLKAQKSISLFARKKYGTSEIDYPLFPQNSYEDYQAFILRNSGSDFVHGNLRDAILTTLMDGSGLETQSYRSVVTYINGNYWGFHNMREKVNEHFIASKHDVDIDSIDIIGARGELVHGSDTDFKSLMSYLENNRLTTAENYLEVTEQVDVDNLIKYLLAEIYFDIRDWPYINLKQWKAKGGKWRWILFDTDVGFGRFFSTAYEYNTLAFALDSNYTFNPVPPESNLLFRRMMDNTTFKNKFINQFADELNSRFLPERVLSHIDSISNGVISEVHDHYIRWGANPGNHATSMDIMKNFALNRPEFIKGHIQEYFDLPDYHEIELSVSSQEYGYIQINSLEIRDSIWTGDYFQDVPIKVTAISKPGYSFSHWDGDSISTEEALVLNLDSLTSLTAFFEPDQVDRSIVINEINYKSSEEQNTGDWIELYNSSDTIVDLSNWTITDKEIDEGFVIPENTTLGGEGFIVITRDLDDFAEFHDISNVIGDLDFGLSSEGELIRLFNQDDQLIDTVSYLPNDPWPELANGTGRTLELLSPELDNSIAENWEAINIYGSPGMKNEEITNTIQVKESINPMIYPNPFADIIHIKFTVEDRNQVIVSIYDMRGNVVHKVENATLNAGDYTYNEDLGFLNTGKYLLEIKIGNSTYVHKWIKG